MRIIVIVILLLSHATSVAAQNDPLIIGRWMAANRFGVKVRESYQGKLEWTHTSGTSHFSASATLLNGRVHCSATSRSEAGSFSATGAGLIEIDLGVEPDEENPPARPGGKMYEIRVACPNPRSPPPHEARWSDEFSTYKQQGGDFDATYNGGQMKVTKIPEQMKGQWVANDPEEQRTMNWDLCLVGWACPGFQPPGPPPQPPPPPPPPPPPAPPA